MRCCSRWFGDGWLRGWCQLPTRKSPIARSYARTTTMRHPRCLLDASVESKLHCRWQAKGPRDGILELVTWGWCPQVHGLSQRQAHSNAVSLFVGKTNSNREKKKMNWPWLMKLSDDPKGWWRVFEQTGDKPKSCCRKLRKKSMEVEELLKTYFTAYQPVIGQSGVERLASSLFQPITGLNERNKKGCCGKNWNCAASKTMQAGGEATDGTTWMQAWR